MLKPIVNQLLKKRVASAVLIVALLCVVLGIYFYLSAQKDLDDPAYIIDRISEHIVLPDDEKPGMLTITDRSKVKTDFLQSSATGDKVLIYQNHKKAIIYRPSKDRVVDILDVNVGDASTEKPKAAWPAELP